MTTRRRRERGQALPVVAILSTVLLGAVALGTDLSLQTHYRRALQNVTDAAALAGAQDLGAKPNQPDRITAATDALHVVYDRMGWGAYGSGLTWSQAAVAAADGLACSTESPAAACDVTTAGPGTSQVSVSVAVPPVHARNAAYDGLWGYVEVEVHRTQATQVAGVLGASSAGESGHSVGYHHAAGQAFGFALYSSSVIAGGNQGEVIAGNVYTDRSIQPQSGGQAGFCAAPSSARPSAIVLGAPQALPYPSPDPAAGQPFQHLVTPQSADTVRSVAACDGTDAGRVDQTAPLGACGALDVQGVDMSTAQDPASLACMADPPVLPPDLQAPTLTGATREDGSALGNNQSVLTVTGPLAPGVYDVVHNPNCRPTSCYDVTVDGHQTADGCAGTPYEGVETTCLLGVTFYLENGATIGFVDRAHAIWTPYAPPAGTTSDPNDGFFPVYAPSGSPAEIDETDNGTQLEVTGTVYLPSGALHVTQNALLSIQGQAIVSAWNVQSGNFTNPEIAWDGARVAHEREMLQLVE